MEEFDLYGDLELLHAQEKQEATEDLKWKDKYAVALSTIQKLQAEKKELNKKIKQLEINFASLFETARVEIKRKDTEICQLRKQRDDICFRRTKPQNAGKQFNNNTDVRRAASSESVQVNPFSGQPIRKKSEQSSDDKLPSTFKNENLKSDKARIYREHDPRNGSHEKDQSRDIHKDRSKDRSRHRNRSRDRVDERSRHRSDDRNEMKHRDRLKERKSNRSRERSNQRDERNKDKKRKRHGRDRSETKSSDINWDKIEITDSDYPPTNEDKNKTSSNRYEPAKLEEKPRDICKSNSDRTKDQTNDLKTELKQLKNVPSSLNEKQINSKIEILQIEILKDVKELKKNKLKAEKMPKPDPIDPAKVAIEKSNQLLEALFDDSLMNKSEEPNDEVYDNLLVFTQQTDSIPPDDNKKENFMKKDENCNLNLQTPQTQSVTKILDDLFGPSPAGSLCTIEENSVKSVGESSRDCDFVPIMKPAKSQKDELTQLSITPKMPVVIDDNCTQNDKTINNECFEMKPPKNPVSVEKNERGILDDDSSVTFKQTDLYADMKKFAKIDENFNIKHQTPQKQQAKKFLDDLFGPSPGDSFSGKKNSGTSLDESSSELYFEPVIKPLSSRISRIDEETQAPTPSKIPIVIDDSSTDNDISINEECQKMEEARQPAPPSSAEEKLTENIVNDAETFKFVELDSSFYSSEDEIDDDLKNNLNTSRAEVESPPFENITPVKNIQAFEPESTKVSNVNTGKSYSEEKSTVLHKSADEKLFELNCAQSTNEEIPLEKCRGTSTNRSKTDDFEKNRNKPSFPENQKQSRSVYHSSERSKERKELFKKDHSEKRSNSSKHNTNSYNSNSMPALEEYHHRFSSSRSEKEKHRRHHHHHHHKHRSKESAHTKSDSSSHRSSRKHSKNNRHEIETKHRYSKDKPNSIGLKTDDDLVKDIPRNQKIRDQDQIFFLHCDDISDDDEIFGEESYTDEYKIESNDDDLPNMDGRNLNKNVIEIEESEITNEVESNKRDMDALEFTNKPLAHENTAEIDKETECTILSLESELKEKVLTLHLLNVATETLNSRIDENPTNTVCSSVDLEEENTPMCDIELETDKSTNMYASGYFNATGGLGDQQFSEEYHLQNSTKSSEKENDIIEIQSIENVEIETVNLDDCEEQDNSELQKSESYKDDQIRIESLNKVDLHEPSQDIQILCSQEVDSKDQQKHEIEEEVQLPNSMDSLHSSSHHVELNKNANVPNKGQSSIEENDAFALLNGDKIEKIHSSNGSDDTSLNNDDRKRQVLDNKKPISDENLEASLQEDLNSDNSSNCELVVRKPITPSYDEFPVELSPLPKGEHCETISHDISCQNLNKPSDTSPKKTVASSTTNENEEMPSQITENIPACSTKTNQNLSHSTILFSPHVSSEKSLNSADELESSHSNSDSVLSGRRKKIKTPRKHTHACKNTPNRTMTMVSNRYTKHDEVHTPILVTESNLTSSEILPELFSPDRDLKDATKLTHYTEPEVLVSSPRLVQNNSVLLDHVKKRRSEEKQDSRDNKMSLEELNGGFENGKEKATDTTPREEKQPIDENKLEFPSKEIRYDQKRSISSLSSSLSEELSQQDEKQGQSTEEPALSISKTNEIPLSFPSKTLLNEDQQNRNSQIDEDCLQTSSSTTYADQVENIKNVSSISSDKTEELHENTELLKEAEKEPTPKAVSPQTSYALPRSELKRIENKEDAGKEKSVESYSITLKRNRNKKRNIQNSTEIVETMSNEEVNDKSKTAFPGESLEVQIHKLTIEEKHMKETTGVAKNNNNHDYVEKSNNEESDKTCSSSIANNNSLKSPTLTLENTKQQQMMEHFNNSEHQLVRTSVINSDEVVDTKPEETNVKKRKRKSNMSLDSSDCEFKNKDIKSSPICEATKVYVKRRYKKKTTQILDNSNSNEDVEVINGSISEESKMVSIDDDTTQKELKAMEDFKSPDSKEPTKKRKHMKKNSKSSSDSTNKSNELCESLEGHENPSSPSHIESTLSISEESKIVSNDDDDTNQMKSKGMDHFKSPDAKEPSKKRKHKQKNSNSSSDSTNKSYELCENLEDHDENPSSPSHIESAMSISEESKIVSNYDDEAMEHFKSPDSKEPTKKRKHKKTKLNSSFESTNKSNELCGNLERRDENPSSPSHIEFAMSISEESKIVPNDDEAMEHFKSPDTEEPSKKRKHKKKNSNSCLDSTNKSNELFESLEGSENPSSPSQLEFTSSSERILESLDGILHSSNQSTVQSLEKSSSNFSDKNLEEFCVDTKVTCVNNSLSGEEKEHDSYNIKPKKAKRQRKRKLSRSLDAKSEDAIVQPKKSKNTLVNTSQASLKTCDATSCPALGKNHRESINQLQPSPSNETTVSIELTPTHHKIFLNDVFPNDPPPVYKANDDDLQYHEIDDRLRSMFQSPSYTQPSNEECTFDNKNDNIHPTTNENVEVDEILNQSESTQFDTSASLRKVSLGSNEYVIQSVGSHTANVFITRKKCKKRTKVVTSAV